MIQTSFCIAALVLVMLPVAGAGEPKPRLPTDMDIHQFVTGESDSKQLEATVSAWKSAGLSHVLSAVETGASIRKEPVSSVSARHSRRWPRGRRQRPGHRLPPPR